MRGHHRRRGARPLGELVHELVVLVDHQRFDHERGRDGGVPNPQRRSSIGVLGAWAWVSGAAVHDGVAPAEPKDGEFVVHRLALASRHFVERGGKPGRPGGRVQRDGARRFGGAMAEHGAVGVRGVQRFATLVVSAGRLIQQCDQRRESCRCGLGSGTGWVGSKRRWAAPDVFLRRRTRADVPHPVEVFGVGRGDLPIVEDEHVVGIDVQPGHTQRRRTSQHRPRSPSVGDHQDVAVGTPGERASLERPVSRPRGEDRLEPVLRRRFAGVVVGRGVVQDDPHPAAGAQLEQCRTHVGLVEVMGDHVQHQSRIGSDFIE